MSVETYYLIDPSWRLHEDYLKEQLWGGRSDGRDFVGLERKVLRAITARFSEPIMPLRFAGSVRVHAVPGSPVTGSPEELRDALREWLCDDPVSHPATRAEVIRLIRDARLEAKRLFRGEPGRVFVAELVHIYLTWLGRTCSHARARVSCHRDGVAFERCPDCGVERAAS